MSQIMHITKHHPILDFCVPQYIYTLGIDEINSDFINNSKKNRKTIDSNYRDEF